MSSMDYLDGGTPANPSLYSGNGFSLGEEEAAPRLPSFIGPNGFRSYREDVGPYTTTYMRSEQQRLRSFRQDTGNFMASQGKTGTAYVWTGYSRKATTSVRQVSDLVDEFASSSNKEKKDMAKLLAMAGYLPGDSLEDAVESATLADVMEAYSALVVEAAQRFSFGEEVSPDDLLEMNIRYNLDKGEKSNDGSFNHKTGVKWYEDAVKQPTGPEVERSSFVDIWSPEDARSLARQTLQSALGRDPSEDEYEDFIAALQAQQRANPTISTTRTQYDDEGNVIGVREKRTGGFGAEAAADLAQDYAESRPGWAEWQAVGTYLPEVFDRLGSVVPDA